MPTPRNIQLDVRNFASNAPWRNVQSSNGGSYSYLYTGGDDASGGMILSVGQGAETASIRLIADSRYQISNCTFTGDTKGQLSWNGSAHAGAIVDINTDAISVKYTLVVIDTGNGSCTVNCDPQIINR